MIGDAPHSLCYSFGINELTALSLAWSLGLAWLVSFVFYQGARALGY